jgi:hypothetical protein
MDYLLKEMLEPTIKQFTHIALGENDFNSYLNITSEMTSYNNSFPVVFIKRTGEPKQLELTGKNQLCYLNKKLQENTSYYFLIVHLTFKEEVAFSFESIIFKNSLQIRKKTFRLLTFYPFKEPLKKVLMHYYKIPKIESVEGFSSYYPFMKVYEKDKLNRKFDISKDKNLFIVDFDLSRVRHFSHFTVEVLP